MEEYKRFPISYHQYPERAENLIVKPAAINHVVYRLIDNIYNPFFFAKTKRAVYFWAERE